MAADKTGGNIIDTSKYNYDKTKYRDGEGKAKFSKSNGDALAKALTGADRDALKQVASDNGLADRFKELAKHDNLGQFRMSLGNSLRAMIRKGVGVKVRGQKITDLKQDVTIARGITVEGTIKAGEKSERRAPAAKKAAKKAKKAKKAAKKAA